jgi:hypothetical protein
VASRVHEATRLECTVGIGENKLQAKLATGFGKPAGVFRLTFGNWFEVLGDRPADALWGIGARTARKLAEHGIVTVRDLASADPDALAAVFGPMTGPWLVMLGCGRGDAEVDDSPYLARGHGREETFQQNIADWSRVRSEVSRIAGLLAGDLAAEPRPAVRVVVKVRYAPFVTQTHGVPLASPSSEAAVIERAALAALDRFGGRRPVRLLGVRAEFGLRSWFSGYGPGFRATVLVFGLPSWFSGYGPGHSPGYSARIMPTSPMPGLEGSGWRSPVSEKPQRSYNRRARELDSVTHRWTDAAFMVRAQSITAAIRASPTPRPRPFGRTYMETSSMTPGLSWYPPTRPTGSDALTSGR